MAGRENRFAVVLVGALVALVLLCRLLPLGHELIGDEAFSARVASLPVGELVAFVARHDAHPPLYYALLGVLPDHDESVLRLRLLSLLAGLLHLVVLWMLGRRMGGARLAWACLGLAGVTLLLCRHGALARNYALLQLGITTAWLVLVGALERGGAWRWALLAVLYALSCLTFYYAFHAIVALSVFFIGARPTRRQVAAYALACGAAAMLFAAWLPSLLEQFERVRTLTAAGWAGADGSVGWIADRLLRRHLLSNAPWGSVWALAALALALVPLYVHRDWFRERPPAPEATRARRWLAPVSWACGAYLLAVLVSALAGSFVRPRYAGFLGTLLCVAAALALLRLPRRAFVLLVVAIGLGGAAQTITRTLRQPDLGVEAATAHIVRHASADDRVLCANFDGKLLYDFHARGRGPTAYGVYVAATPRDNPAWARPDVALEDAASLRRVLATPASLWILWMLPELSGPDAEARLRAALEERRWRSVERRTWPRGVALERFVR